MSSPSSPPSLPEPSPAAAPPALTEVETHGVERIPDADRTAPPLDLFRVAFGGANTFSTCVLGAFPILFGLSFWQGLAATLLGVVAGALILCPMAVFGPVNGTNNAVSSSAHLGVHGRVVGSFLSVSVWSSSDALVGGGADHAAQPGAIRRATRRLVALPNTCPVLHPSGRRCGASDPWRPEGPQQHG